MTVMNAKYAGKCSFTGRSFAPGARIDYDYRTKKCRLIDDESAIRMENDLGDEQGSAYLASRTRSDGYVSNVFRIGGREYYRNKRGKCEDAPCCSCCTI